MKTATLALITAFLPATGLFCAEPGEHRLSGDKKTEVVYIDTRHAIFKGKDSAERYEYPLTKEGWMRVDGYSISEAEYKGPPELAEFTGDLEGKSLVADVVELLLFEHIAIGVGLEPKDKPPKQWLYFIADLNSGETKFFEAKEPFEAAVFARVGVRNPVLLPVEVVMKDLKTLFDSKHK